MASYDEIFISILQIGASGENRTLTYGLEDHRATITPRSLFVFVPVQLTVAICAKHQVLLGRLMPGH